MELSAGLSLFFQIIAFVVVSEGNKINDCPIIGVLAQDVYSPSPGKNAYIAASYVKYLESAGARVVPVMSNKTEEEYTILFRSINGILFPGGGASIFSSGYAKAAGIFYKLALEANSKGDYFPVWGTCLGFQQLMLLTSGKSLLSRTNTSGVALPLNFTKDFRLESIRESLSKLPNGSMELEHAEPVLNRNRFSIPIPNTEYMCKNLAEVNDSRMFKDVPEDLMTSLANEPLTEHSHKWSVSTEKFNGNEELKIFYRILSTNTDGQTEFVSTMEAYDFPIYGTQWHPEKNAFEWTRAYIPHSTDAIRTTFYMGQFFVNEARKSLHKFPSRKEEQDALIYNYQPAYTSKERKKSLFGQTYYFN